MYSGIAIALAWPETLCKQAGAWYDSPLKWLGINKSNYYKVGHAAVVLIEKSTGACHYFDFGRYHSPYQHGRVRSSFTDHDLEMKTRAAFNEQGGLMNYNEILWELHNNESCHGNGNLHASYCEVDFNKTFRKTNQMQLSSPIPYGPFLPHGTNCSRFVNTIIVSGSPKWYYKLILAYPKTLSPTPIGNVKALSNYAVIGVTCNSPVLKPTLSTIPLSNEIAMFPARQIRNDNNMAIPCDY
ncbi:MAG: hypothetical protein Q8M29_17015 [Bacteroidota bacterium]|nr:hypothetical protein [Bacteroidota bacterium]